MMLKNKLLLWSPIITLAVGLLFSLASLPSIHPVPRELPIALVNEDEGAVLPDKSNINMGDQVTAMSKKAFSQKEGQQPVKWVKLNEKNEAMKGMNEREYYGALILPKDFSKKLVSLQTASPSSPKLQILVNQGMNSSASAMASQLLNGVADQINGKVREQIISGLKQKKDPIPIDTVSVLATPIKKETMNVNAFGTHSANGNSPVSLFQPLWMGSLIGAVLLFVVLKKTVFTSRKEKFQFITKQFLVGIFLAALFGWGITWFADGILQLDIPSKMDTAIFLSIAYLSFLLMMLAVVSWIGMKGFPLFALLLFFGAPLLSMAPEIMPEFYQNWIFPWLPMRYMTDGLRDLFFFGNGLSWDHVQVLCGIGITSLVLLLLSALIQNEKQKISADAEEKLSVL
ncbi:YhgE/Pip N-terminal domain-containing protein [Fictibacillus solisalsi]|uniref:YhgE/Pip N-terminal domain-containing protein n=2 Tax=Fictibacillus solisalsi TaxID=459525 RepID=A0A1G9TQK8_9BACL|nr:YhgE/Pip N-terminal domain-containing protein [Fictibacillus solisalsi]